MKIQQHFRHSCAEGRMDNWEPRKERGHPVLTAGTRYLSPRGDDLTQQFLPLDKIVDPLGILQNMVPTAVHTAENQVLYFERIMKGKR